MTSTVVTSTRSELELDHVNVRLSASLMSLLVFSLITVESVIVEHVFEHLVYLPKNNNIILIKDEFNHKFHENVQNKKH